MCGPVLPEGIGLVSGKQGQAGPWEGPGQGTQISSTDIRSSDPRVASSVLSPCPGISKEDVTNSRESMLFTRTGGPCMAGEAAQSRQDSSCVLFWEQNSGGREG